MKELLSKKAKEITPYVAGEQPKGTDIIKLNTNESPYAPSPHVFDAIDSVKGDILRKYPDPSGGAFREAAAELTGKKVSEVFCGNGSDEVLAFAFQAFFGPDRGLTAPDITYSFYPVWARLYEIPYHTIPLNDRFEMDVSLYTGLNTGIVIANPNAPTGIALTKKEIASIVQNNPDYVVIVDEAYVGFGSESAVDLTNDYDNLLVVRTLSKAQSLAGIRAGYAVGCEALIDGMMRIKDSVNSYPVNRITSEAAAAALRDDAYYRGLAEKIVKTRAWTVGALKKLDFKVLDSKTNFIFAAPPENKLAKQVFEALKENKIFVRWFNLPRIDDYLRITIGTDDEMKKLVACIDTILG